MESLEICTKSILKRSLKVKEKLLNDDKVIKDIAKAADLVTSGYKKNKKLMLKTVTAVIFQTRNILLLNL